MPPVRTRKKNTASADAAPLAKRGRPKATKGLKPPAPKGAKDVYFESSERDWDGKYQKVIGTGTRNIRFGFQFILTDYDAKNKAELTTDVVVRLAKACPKLRKIELQAAYDVGEDALLALFENCPALTHLELTSLSGGNGITGTSLDALRENPEWAPRLKKLIVGENEDNKDFMKAMRALGKAREAMTITLLRRQEYKKWGDWELDVYATDYKKGRKYSKW